MKFITEILLAGALVLGFMDADVDDKKDGNYMDYLVDEDDSFKYNTGSLERRDEIIVRMDGRVDKITKERDSLDVDLEATSDELETSQGNVRLLEDEVAKLKDELSEAKKIVPEEVETVSKPVSQAKPSPEKKEVEETPIKESVKPEEEGKPEEKAEESTPPPTQSKSTGQTFQATYYTAFCDTGCTGVTADGTDVSNSTTKDGRGIIATDPSVIPLGTVVEVDGKEYVSADTGGNIKGNRIDILVASKDVARSKGRHNVTVDKLK